jgi:hypothetical protein
MKLPIEDGKERQGIDPRSLTHQTRRDCQTKQTMSHRLPERVAFRGGMVDVQRVEVSGESGEQDDIGFRHGPPWALPFIADDKIIE